MPNSIPYYLTLCVHSKEYERYYKPICLKRETTNTSITLNSRAIWKNRTCSCVHIIPVPNPIPYNLTLIVPSKEYKRKCKPICLQTETTNTPSLSL